MTRLILVRHGETDANTAGCFLGALDVPLSTNPETTNTIENLANSLNNGNFLLK